MAQQPRQYPNRTYPKPGLRRANSGSGVKTFVIVMGVLAATGLLVCGGVVGLIALGFFGIQKVEQQRQAEIDAKIEAEAAALNAPPANFDDAIIDLNKDNKDRRIAVLKWLRDEPVNSAVRRRIANAIAGCLKNRNKDESTVAMDALKRWSDPSIAPMIADSLRSKDEQTFQKLELLKQFRDKSTYPAIAKLLEDSRWAGQAKATLLDIGSDAKSAIVVMLDGRNSQAKTYARELLNDLGIDQDDAQLSALLAKIKSGDSVSKSLLALTKLPPSEAQRSAVNQATLEVLKSGSNEKECFQVFAVWGDKSVVRDLNRIVSSSDTSSFDKGLGYKALGAIGDDSSIPVLVRGLSATWGKKEAADALENFGEQALSEILKFYNAEDSSLRTKVRSIVTNLGGSETAILEQCSNDLVSTGPKVQLAACEYLKNAEVVEEKRAQVAARLGNLMNDDDISVFDKPKIAAAYINWAGKEQANSLVALLSNREDSVWKPVFRKLVAMSEFQKIKEPTAKLLDDFFKKKEFIELLISLDSEVEDLMIEMFQHSDEDVVINACQVTARVGTKKSIQPLKDLLKRAGRYKKASVANAVRFAGTEVSARVQKEAPTKDEDKKKTDK